jgi:hypothetical protein
MVIADCVAGILGVWLSLAPWYGDRHDSPEAREALYRPVAVAICKATEDPGERAFLGSQAYHETRLARYVLEGRCHDGPVGARCDDGRARGPWQVHRWCRAAWRETETAAARRVAAATCVLRGWRYGLRRWGSPAGGFQAQGGISRAVTHRARRRVPLWQRMLAVLR